MTGIQRLRKLIEDYRAGRECDGFECTELSCGKCMAKNVLEPIADQIEREQDKVAKTDWESVREVAADMAGRTFMSATIDGLLCDWSRKLTSAADGHDHANDVSMSAYDLLPQEDREAIAWVRERGGLDAVKKLLGWVVGHCSTRQQLDFDFWLSGRVMHELGFEEDMADRDEVERRLLARLMPEGYEWPRYESGELLRYKDRYIQDGRERIVRCRDCVDHFSHNGSMVCGNFSNPEDGYYVVVQQDGFCAWGEPREGD